MHKCRSALKSFTSIGLALLTLSTGLFSASTLADTGDLQPSPVFSYETGHMTSVEIALTGTGGAPALISLYSKGHNGLRLLQNGFTDHQGRYSSELQLPAHLDRVVLVIRSAERQDSRDIAIGNQMIAYAD
jgi:hypothetical protein